MTEELKQEVEEIKEDALQTTQQEQPQAEATEEPRKGEKKLDEFQRTIKAYLDKRAAEDELFAKSYAKEKKSIRECCNYIISEVRKSGRCGFADDEIFGMAVHYYDENDLGTIPTANAKVVVNHAIQLTEEEKAAAKARALAQFEAEEKRRLEWAADVSSDKASSPKPKAKKPEAKKKEPESTVPSLFDFGMEDEE